VTPIVPLAGESHAVYRLAADLLLVFKPAGHREAEHVHTRAQRLRVLRGQLRVERAGAATVLGPASEPLTLAAGESHATVALTDTWLVAEDATRIAP
jgi:quercetin dioxygenase-like cupin family protein